MMGINTLMAKVLSLLIIIKCLRNLKLIVPFTLVKTMHFECKAFASTNVLRVRITNEKWKPYNKPITSPYSLGNKISL